MADLTFITTCKGRLHHLKQTLPLMATQPDVECVVVDYNCPHGTGDWVAVNYPGVRLVRVSDEPGYNAARARNLGAAAAGTPWFVFIDADIRVDAGLGRFLAERMRRKLVLRPHPLMLDTWGTFCCAREDFDAVGGYDEVIQGWGGEDDDILVRLKDAGCDVGGFPAALVSAIPHTDEERTVFHAVSDIGIQRRINSLYLTAKRDLTRLLASAPDRAVLQRLHQEVQRTVLASAAQTPPSSAELTVDIADIGTTSIPAAWRLTRKLVYSFTPRDKE